uniref:Uncharacterized protein n=1 Tax=Sinocyclocheilus rhinocerous TaxID=307959 RepID=A0A673KAM3_9TELE
SREVSENLFSFSFRHSFTKFLCLLGISCSMAKSNSSCRKQTDLCMKSADCKITSVKCEEMLIIKFCFQGENFLTLITNFIETTNQTLGNCPEVRQKFSLHHLLKLLQSTSDASMGNEYKPYQMENRKLHLKSCLYDEIAYPYCSIFQLGAIVNKTGHKFEEMGGTILIEWPCDLDKEDSNCRPHYSFVRLGNSSEIVAYNFRFAHYSTDAAGQKRKKHFTECMEFIYIMVFGTVCDSNAKDIRARKFSIIPTIISIASALTLMAAVSI